MTRPRLLDLFCCQGGASAGYVLAGFDVVGVDIAPQPRYPFEFVQGDALDYLAEHGAEFDAIHASPPCQARTTMSNRWRGAGGKADEWANLIPATLAALAAMPQPWIVENVPGARADMPGACVLHGGMFDLPIDRPRLFVSNVPLMVYRAARTSDPVGVYGKAPDGRRLFTRSDGTEQRAVGSVDEARTAMRMPWADWDGCREAIPPAYTQFIGEQIIAHLGAVAA